MLEAQKAVKAGKIRQEKLDRTVPSPSSDSPSAGSASQKAETVAVKVERELVPATSHTATSIASEIFSLPGQENPLGAFDVRSLPVHIVVNLIVANLQRIRPETWSTASDVVQDAIAQSPHSFVEAPSISLSDPFPPPPPLQTAPPLIEQQSLTPVPSAPPSTVPDHTSIPVNAMQPYVKTESMDVDEEELNFEESKPAGSAEDALPTHISMTEENKPVMIDRKPAQAQYELPPPVPCEDGALLPMLDSTAQRLLLKMSQTTNIGFADRDFRLLLASKLVVDLRSRQTLVPASTSTPMSIAHDTFKQHCVEYVSENFSERWGSPFDLTFEI